MKKRTLAALLALSLVLSLGAGAFAADGDDLLWFATEDGQTKFVSETPATVTMSVTVPEDGTYLITTGVEVPTPEYFSVTSENEVLTALMEEQPFQMLSNEPVELTAGDYSFTVENVTILNISLLPFDNTGLPDDIPPAAERVDADFWFQDGDLSSSLFEAEEPSSVTMTATVEQDGLYLVHVYAEGNESLSLTVDSDALAFINQLPLEYLDEDGVYRVYKCALVELTAGEYTLQVENSTFCYVDMELTHPLDAVDGVIGEGLYVCPLDEAMTVNYTVMGVGSTVMFYSGAAQAMSSAGMIMVRDKNSEQQSISFMPGMAVIDFEGGSVTSALVGGDGAESASQAQSPSESMITEEDVLNYYGLTAEEFAALKAAIAAQIQEEWTADEAYDSNLMGLYDWTYMTDFVDIRIHSDETSDITEMLGEDIGKNLMTDQSMDRCIEELAQYCTGDDPLFQQRAMVLGHAINRWAADNGESYERWCMVWEDVLLALSAYVTGTMSTDGSPTDAYIRPLFEAE